MATPIKRIEKEFLLKVLYDEQIPIVCFRNRIEHTFTIEKPTKEQIFLKGDKPVAGLKIRKKLDFMFDYRGQVIMFAVELSSVKDEHIIGKAPEFLYKNLDRSFSRVSTPQDLQVQFTFLGDRYSLTYPKVQEFEHDETGGAAANLDPKNLTGLIDQMAAWIKAYANGYKFVLFKDVQPATTEERILAETGKTLDLHSTQGSLPNADPYPKKRLITEDIFLRYLESTGVDVAYVNDACTRFIKSKLSGGIFSDLWVPVLFQQYVIGYIHAWINKEGTPPFNYEVINSLYQFAKIFAYSLKMNGYFENGKLKNEPFEGRVIDISVSGLLFAYPHSALTSSLLPDSELSVRLMAPRRTVNANTRIVRCYKDKISAFLGCRFLDMEPEDIRFLFEYIYGKPFTDNDAVFLAGQV
jgi:hypothetical protein